MAVCLSPRLPPTEAEKKPIPRGSEGPRNPSASPAPAPPTPRHTCHKRGANPHAYMCADVCVSVRVQPEMKRVTRSRVLTCLVRTLAHAITGGWESAVTGEYTALSAAPRCGRPLTHHWVGIFVLKTPGGGGRPGRSGAGEELGEPPFVLSPAAPSPCLPGSQPGVCFC